MTKQLPADVKHQLILDQMAQDPAGQQGPSTIKEAITWNTGIHLTSWVHSWVQLYLSKWCSFFSGSIAELK